MLETYHTHVQRLLQTITEKEAGALKEAGRLAAEAIENGGILHCFGAGHSHMIGEELFYRAGGLAPVKPHWVQELLLESGGARASEWERDEGFAVKTAQNLDLEKHDVLLVASTSGRNPAPVEAALAAREKNIPVIALTSSLYEGASRHSSGKKLKDVGTVVIDTHVPSGDAALTDDNVPVPFAAVSSMAALFAAQAVSAEATARLGRMKGGAPVFLSGNIDGSDAWNRKLIDRYKKRIPALAGEEEIR
ncbi:SIS domain-containing protein [Alkalicoccus urumqiensis]|nr:SIS domain-containing protein [Alkalicoccus urumqiensis]